MSQMPPHRMRSMSRRLINNEIEFAPEVMQAVVDIRSETVPFSWAVCGYDPNASEGQPQRLVLLEKGMVWTVFYIQRTEGVSFIYLYF